MTTKYNMSIIWRTVRPDTALTGVFANAKDFTNLTIFSVKKLESFYFTLTDPNTQLLFTAQTHYSHYEVMDFTILPIIMT